MLLSEEQTLTFLVASKFDLHDLHHSQTLIYPAGIPDFISVVSSGLQLQGPDLFVSYRPSSSILKTSTELVGYYSELTTLSPLISERIHLTSSGRI